MEQQILICKLLQILRRVNGRMMQLKRYYLYGDGGRIVGIEEEVTQLSYLIFLFQKDFSCNTLSNVYNNNSVRRTYISGEHSRDRLKRKLHVNS